METQAKAAAPRTGKWKHGLMAGMLLAISGALFTALATQSESLAGQSALLQVAERWFTKAVEFGFSILFYDVGGFPFIVLWLMAGGIFFTLRLKFINLRMFGHAIQVVRGRYTSPDEPGEVSHFQALAAAVSATVGLGNIAGVAVAVSVGGPGAVIWMMIAGFLGMSTKCAEVTLGQKYRQFDKRGRVSGGAFYYLEHGLAEKNMPRFGKVMAIIFAFCCLGGTMGGGNMFQANQAVNMMTNTYDVFNELDNGIALVLAVAVGMVLIGGIRRIATVAEAIVPFMAILYIGCALTVIFTNSDKISEAVAYMFSQAFSFQAAGGAMLGAVIQGFRRAAFSNEAGVGSAPIAHAAARTREPAREGLVALLEPFIDTIVICFMTGLAITISGVYATAPEGSDGALLTSMAFATVNDWFPVLLSICIGLFAYSTMISWSYYGENAWRYLFGGRTVGLYHILFCAGTFFGGVINFGVVLDFSDVLFFSMAIPNLIGLYLMNDVIKNELESYVRRLKAGEFPVYSKQQKAAIQEQSTPVEASTYD